ncbi:hypothetical protein TNCV_1268581 [Trichonephila clavipes]|nr:hypothetical protein TNCV_1268581 [Trichonephila clavipes]
MTLQRPQMLEKVIENWTSRLDYILASRGSPMPEIIFKMYSAYRRHHGLVVACPPRAPKVAGSTSAGVDIFSGCENRRHACHMIMCCQVIYSQFGLAIHENDHQARRRFVEWAQNEIAVVLDFHKRILFSDEAHFWLKGYVNKQNCRIWSEANPQVYVETPLHPEKLTVWCALWAGGILLQKR